MSQSEDLKSRLGVAIADMLAADETISTRNIMKRMPLDFGYPSAISRPKDIRPIYECGRKEQLRIRSAAKSLTKNSRSDLEAAIVRRNMRIGELEAQVELLVASHRALYAAVGEMGGVSAWLAFFEHYHSAIETLEKLGARSSQAPVFTLISSPESDSTD